jgi:serine/threonine-protein kinase
MGQNVDAVEKLLTDKGLQVVRVPGTGLPTGDPKINTVYDASPLGTMPVGTSVNITYYIEDSTQTAPSN